MHKSQFHNSDSYDWFSAPHMKSLKVLCDMFRSLSLSVCVCVCVCVTCAVRRGLVLSQRAQAAAGGTERSASRVGAEAGSDRVVLERVGLTARVKVRVRRRLHRRHARVIRVQIRVIHFVHVERGRRRESSGCGVKLQRNAWFSRGIQRVSLGVRCSGALLRWAAGVFIIKLVSGRQWRGGGLCLHDNVSALNASSPLLLHASLMHLGVNPFHHHHHLHHHHHHHHGHFPLLSNLLFLKNWPSSP